MDLEKLACVPVRPNRQCFNARSVLPFGLTVEHLSKAMGDFCDFLETVNSSLILKEIPRLESICMSANFSSIVGEFHSSTIPKHCSTIVKNTHHNGHPDLVPQGMYRNDDVEHGEHGIEIKGSRYYSGWQGHNAEDCWLMVIVYRASRQNDRSKSILPVPFGFAGIYGARLERSDWSFSGRSETSRRTITASVKRSGMLKMKANWLYEDPRIASKISAAGPDAAQPALELQ
jgi:hypothetical protein